MRLGIVARADNRGLGVQTRAFVEHLEPAAVLVVEMGPSLTPFREDFSCFDRTTCRVAPLLAGTLPAEAIEWLVRESDVILTAETPYDYDLIVRARSAGVGTVVQGNHEFMRWTTEPDLPRPDLFLAPSTWHVGLWPQPTVVLPFPVDRERFPFRLRTGPALELVHVAGHRARADRAGTRLVLQAMRSVRAPVRLTIRSQDRLGGSGPYSPRDPRRRHVEIVVADVEDNRDLYRTAEGGEPDAAIQPRRYGGQSLPLNEELSLGLPVIALDREPERGELPSEALVPARRSAVIPTQGGPVGIWTCDPRMLAVKIDRLATDGEFVERLSRAADQRSDRIAWSRLKPRYLAALGSVAAR